MHSGGFPSGFGNRLPGGLPGAGELLKWDGARCGGGQEGFRGKHSCVVSPHGDSPQLPGLVLKSHPAGFLPTPLLLAQNSARPNRFWNLMLGEQQRSLAVSWVGFTNQETEALEGKGTCLSPQRLYLQWRTGVQTVPVSDRLLPAALASWPWFLVEYTCQTFEANADE